MNTKAILALALAALLPVVSYLLVKGYSDNAVQMPHRYYYDSTIEKVVNGKQVNDTLWHKVGNIKLTNQLGKEVELDSIHNKVLVVDFFFTHCPTICPGMTKSMRRLQTMMHSTDPRKVIDTPLVQFLSFSIDPERDSAPVLKKFADKYGVDPDSWWLLTGDKQKIYDFGIREMKLGMIDGNGVDTLFEHSPRFVLLDKDRIVRGMYNGLDSMQVLKLSQDIVFLSLEKDRKKPSPIIQELKGLWPIFLIVLVAVMVFLVGARNRKPKTGQ